MNSLSHVLSWGIAAAALTSAAAFADFPYGPDTCMQGYVWREAFPDDHVCVTPATRSQASYDNSQAAARRQPGGGPYGPDTCRQGYVWREANPADHVCVTPATRTQTWYDNAHAEERFLRNHWTCGFCNDGTCQCGYGTDAGLCSAHGGVDPSIGCTQSASRSLWPFGEPPRL